jgi:hypothetical protein
MTWSRLVLAVTGLVLSATVPAAAQHAHLGIRAGVDLDRDDALIGAQLTVPLGGRVELYPSFDYYFVESGSLVGLSIDLKFRAVGGVAPLYLGGGLNFLRNGGGGDTGADLFAGLEGRGGAVHPFLEFRVLLHDNTSSQLMVGLNWGL